MAHILIADDTEIVRRALELALKRMGHEAQSTSCPHVALDLARADPPDLALLDVCMPGMDGLSLYKKMCTQLGDRCPRVLFISGTPPDCANVQAEMPRYPVGYLKKPFLLGELSQAISEALAPGR